MDRGERQPGFVFDAQDIVGESLIWDENRKALVWVDIIGQRIHQLDPVTRDHQSWSTPDLATSIGLRRDGGAIVGLRKDVVLWDFAEAFRTIATIEPDSPDTRLNEGVVAPDGSFWVGTMENNIGPDDRPRDISRDAGRIYRVDTAGIVEALSADRFGITNTMVWMADDTFITADTTKNQIFRYHWDRVRSRITDRRPFFSDFSRGLPDGSCMDAEGYVWNCRVAGGGCLVRISPDGVLDKVVELPCSWPTSCTFGGENFDILFVTSARFTMSERHLRANPREGGLFAVRAGVGGTPTKRFG